MEKDVRMKEVNLMTHHRSGSNCAPFRFAVMLFLLCCGWILPGSPGAEESAVSGPEIATPQAADAETIHIGYGADPGDVGLALARKVYSVAFGRVGKRVKISSMPGERSLIEANAGRLDGDATRFGSACVEDQYSNLIRVREPLLVSNTSVFSIQISAEIQSWSGLAELSPRVVFIRGYKLVESRLFATGLQDRAFKVADHANALRFLTAGRADVLISTEPSVRTFLDQPEFRSSGIRRIGVLERASPYLYLHKRHAVLAERMAEVLREMKADGTYRRLFQGFTRDSNPKHTEGYWLQEENGSSGNFEPPPGQPERRINPDAPAPPSATDAP